MLGACDLSTAPMLRLLFFLIDSTRRFSMAVILHLFACCAVFLRRPVTAVTPTSILLSGLLCLLVVPVKAEAELPVSGLTERLQPLQSQMQNSTGVYLLEYGEEALMGRAWLTAHAERSIDVQYFIWSSDNIGTLAAEALLSAAERGVKVRVLVDDLLIDADDVTLLSLEAHPNVEVKIYNPLHSVGVSGVKRFLNIALGFRQVNQRMHDKTATFDGVVGITGGRNMADEYYDFDQQYNFRDRDILLVGQAVKQMTGNFEQFWQSDLSKPISDLLQHSKQQLTQQQVREFQQQLHLYAQDPANFAPEVRQALADLPRRFSELVDALVWTEVKFVHDMPGKNSGKEGLKGGGRSTDSLVQVLASAKRTITIQSPYLILPEGGMDFFSDKIAQGVKVKIVTNSLASTDNLPAFSGYAKIREDLLAIGVELYEFRPHPLSQRTLMARYPQVQGAGREPIFALHAKSFVVDGQLAYVGTFNLDPRSANLNTEVGALFNEPTLSSRLEQSILNDMLPVNSWRVTKGDNPDKHASLAKRAKLMGFKLLPLDPIL
ncbi:phospholipase D family protein [Corallincola luteus]|uniref:Phospholipase D family protein n=2 Tax=Corallincola luteus TaxID=1775177 RepID=A0ABY2ALC3_9GAMM|nr:phospholipase D family protein [Corallincola luteus]